MGILTFYYVITNKFNKFNKMSGANIRLLTYLFKSTNMENLDKRNFIL